MTPLSAAMLDGALADRQLLQGGQLPPQQHLPGQQQPPPHHQGHGFQGLHPLGPHHHHQQQQGASGHEYLHASQRGSPTRQHADSNGGAPLKPHTCLHTALFVGLTLLAAMSLP